MSKLYKFFYSDIKVMIFKGALFSKIKAKKKKIFEEKKMWMVFLKRDHMVCL